MKTKKKNTLSERDSCCLGAVIANTCPFTASSTAIRKYKKKRVLIDGEKFKRLLLGSHNKQDAYKVVGTGRRLERS